MNMVVVVVALRTGIFAERIQHGIVWCRNGMHNALFNKCLQGTVDRYTVKLLAGLFFNVGMRQCAIICLEEFQYPAPAFRDAELAAFQNFCGFIFHIHS